MSKRGQAYLGLHVLADDDPRWPHDPVEQARIACEAGVPVIQLRVKHATDGRALDWARKVRALTRASGARFVLNDRYDIALACEADAVHLGQSDLPPSALPEDARRRLDVGRSTHTREQLEAARDEDIDYVAFGPVFGTTSKESEYSERGLAFLAEAVGMASPRPLVAIGGIQAQHLDELRRAGVAGIAVISALASAEDPRAVAEQLMAGLRGESP